jgi:hypothetical protein
MGGGSRLRRRLTLRLKEVRRPIYRSTITIRYHLMPESIKYK